MNPTNPTFRPHPSAPWWRWSVTGLSVLGLALSGFLSWHTLNGGAMIGCGGGSPCDDVLNSRWSTIAGVLPVSGLAASAYLAMLVCSLSLGPANPAPVRRLAWRALLLLAGAAAGSAVWFIAVQKWIVGAFCPYCMATHVTGLLLASLVIWRASRRALPLENAEDCSKTDRTVAALYERRSQPLGGHRPTLQESPSDPSFRTAPSVAPTNSPPPSVFRRLSFFFIGLALAGILAAAQAGLPPSNVSRGGESAGVLSAVDPHAVPLVGSPDARYVVTLLFDYECPHCQQLHLMLGEAIRRYHGQLAFALCPTPLNRHCNPYIPRDADEFKDSCDLTRIALAVWLADRAAFAAFDNWMYSFDSGDRWRPRTPDAARAKAIELVGRAKFDAAMNDPWIDRYLQSSVRLYGETMQNGRGGVPKLVFGPRWINPQPATAADLLSILQTSLGVPKP